MIECPANNLIIKRVTNDLTRRYGAPLERVIRYASRAHYSAPPPSQYEIGVSSILPFDYVRDAIETTPRFVPAISAILNRDHQ